MKVLNFGSLNLDYVYAVDHFVRPGETLSSLSQRVVPGGKGLNQSIALARAGAAVYHAGRVGAGGGSLRALLAENGVDTGFLPDTEELQGNAVIQVTPAGENCILLFGGSNQCVTEEQIDRTLAAFQPGDYLVLQNEINLLPRIVDRAYTRGLRIVLNPSPWDGKLDEVDFAKLSWLLMNEVEAGEMTGSQEPETAWEIIHGRYPLLSAVITLGGAGSAAWRVTSSGTEHARQAAFPAVAADTTAAGDTYTGYFIAGLMEGLPLGTCMARASMAAAISVTRPGAAPSIPTRDEVEAALAAAAGEG
jgi:ribokinase